MAPDPPRRPVIGRIWRGATSAADGDAYAAYLEDTGVREYRETPGNRGVLVLRQEADGLARFTIVSLWDSLDAIRAFAGDDVEVARFYPEDDAFLVDRELTAEHHEVGAIRHPAHAVASLDHLSVSGRDAAAIARFYEAALAPLGIERVATGDDGSVGFGRDGADDFWVGAGPQVSGPIHVAFTAPTRAAVDAFHAAALAAGGRDNGAPGLRPEYHEHYYAAFVLDPDGRNVEAVCHLPRGR